jgi:hypothetical protein
MRMQHSLVLNLALYLLTTELQIIMSSWYRFTSVSEHQQLLVHVSSQYDCPLVGLPQTWVVQWLGKVQSLGGALTYLCTATV